MAEQEQQEKNPARMTAAGRYENYLTDRQAFLDRARECAKLTIPAIMPPEGHSGSTKLEQPYQSIGSIGVNNLTAKLLMALFPPGQGFFRLTMDDFLVEKLKQNAQANGQDGDDARATFEKALGQIERSVTNRMEQLGNRTVNGTALLHLVVTGNGLIFVKPDGSEKFFPLDRYVVKRDLDGDVLEIIVKETLARVACPPEVQAVLKTDTTGEGTDREKNVDLFTWVVRQPNGSWMVHQEVEGSIIQGTRGKYPKDLCPWIPLRWREVSNEDYGRGHCEEHLGDLVSAEALQQAIVEISVQAAKVLWLTDENGTTDKDFIARAPSGSVGDGKATDVSVVMLEKMQDFQVAKATLDDIRHRLERAFLQASAVQRDAERVTAEEIRAMIGELEQGLGGVYAILAAEFQRPLAGRIMHQMTKAKQLPRLPKDVAAPQIVTGLDGLGRQTDFQKMNTLLQSASTIFGPQAVAAATNIGSYISRGCSSLGIDANGMFKTDQQVAQEQQVAQQQSLAEKTAPVGVKAAADLAKARLQQGDDTNPQTQAA